MKSFEIMKVDNSGNIQYLLISNLTGKYFAGYDFMGSVNWQDEITDECYLTSRDEAHQIARDLVAAGEPEVDPDQEYLLKAEIDGEQIAAVMTAKRIAEVYDEDQECGIYSDMKVYDITGEPRRVPLLAIVEPILSQKRWSEQEYRDYCEAERYGEV